MQFQRNEMTIPKKRSKTKKQQIFIFMFLPTIAFVDVVDAHDCCVFIKIILRYVHISVALMADK